MGLARLLTRSSWTRYTATSSNGDFAEWAVTDLSPSWSRGEYQGGMGIPGAWRASLLVADTLAALPLRAFRERAGRPPELLPTPPLLGQPNPPDPRVATFSSLLLDLLWHGNALAVVAARNREGWPTAMLPVPAENVTVTRASPWNGIDLPVGHIAYGVGNRWFDVDDVIHVKGPCRPGALRGFGVLEAHLNGTLDLDAEQRRQARAASGGGVPTGLLKVDDTPENPLDDTEARQLKDKWKASQRSADIAVLNGRTSFETLAWNPSDRQLLDARRYSLHEIALIFGLDPSWLGVANNSRTYQNVQQESANLVKYSLGGHIARLEQSLSLHFPRGTWVSMNVDALLRGTTKERYEAHEIGIRAGVLKPSEARALEDRAPVPGLDERWAESVFSGAPQPRPPQGDGDQEEEDQ